MNRDSVERVVTNELNGRELNVSTERLQREAEQALRGHNAHDTNQNYRMYNEMAARAHLPQLELVSEHQNKPAPHHEAAHHSRPAARHAQESIPLPPVLVEAPRVEAPHPAPQAASVAPDSAGLGIPDYYLTIRN